MRRIVVCTSSSGLDYLDKPDNIRLLRHHVEIHGKAYTDGNEMTFRDIANQMLADKDLLPISSPPPVDEIVQFFEGLYQEGYQEVFLVTISALLSGTYENLKKAKEKFDKDMFIHIFDSRTLSYSEALLALEASEMLKKNMSSFDIANRLDVMRENNSLWFVIDDLRNMIKTKRMSAPAGFVANMLDIKPVLHITEAGKVEPIDKVRKIEKALKNMCDRALKELEERPGELYIIHLGSDSLVREVANMLGRYGLKNLPIYPTASSAIANHGPYGAGIGIHHDC